MLELLASSARPAMLSLWLLKQSSEVTTSSSSALQPK